MIILKSKINFNDDVIKDVISEVDSYAASQPISKKDRTHIRLLTEESVSFLKTTLKDGCGELTIEPSDGEYAISFVIDSFLISEDAKKRLIETSSKGKNEYYQGFTGKIRQAIDWIASGSENCIYMGAGDISIRYSAGLINSLNGFQWSYSELRKSITDKEGWDELERSILSKLAKEILIGIKNNTITLKVVYKTSQN